MFEILFTAKNITQFKQILSSLTSIKRKLFHTKQLYRFEKTRILLNAVEYNYFDIVDYIIPKGAMIHYNNYECLIRSVSNGHVQTTKVLLDHEANVNIANDVCLSIACKENYHPLVLLLLQYGANPDARNSLIKYACKYNHAGLVKYCIEHKCDIHINEDFPLITACMNGSIDALEVLLNRGDYGYWTLCTGLYIGLQIQNEEVVKTILSLKCNFDVLLFNYVVLGCSNGLLYFVEICLRHLDIDKLPTYNDCLNQFLSVALKNGKMNVAEYLIEKGAVQTEKMETKILRLAADSEFECPICFEISDDIIYAIKKCGHKFHAKCYNKWRPSCPMCRATV